MEMKFIYTHRYKALDLLPDKLRKFWIFNHIIIEMILELLVYIFLTFTDFLVGYFVQQSVESFRNLHSLKKSLDCTVYRDDL